MKYQELSIYRPCISRSISQYFGDNKACIDSKGRIFGTKTVCPSGQSFYESIGMKGHNGNDIPGLLGEDIYHAATFEGWLSHEVDSEGGLGVDVVSYEPLFFPMPIPRHLIATAVPCSQDGVQGFTHYVKMRYWHLKAPVGISGKRVSCGAVIGLMGNTGASSGVHLHFAPKWCLKDGNGVGQANGYAGAFSPAAYYNHDVTARDHVVYLKEDPLPLTKTEEKDMRSQLSKAQALLLSLQKIIHKI